MLKSWSLPNRTCQEVHASDPSSWATTIMSTAPENVAELTFIKFCTPSSTFSTKFILVSMYLMPVGSLMSRLEAASGLLKSPLSLCYCFPTFSASTPSCALRFGSLDITNGLLYAIEAQMSSQREVNPNKVDSSAVQRQLTSPPSKSPLHKPCTHGTAHLTLNKKCSNHPHFQIPCSNLCLFLALKEPNRQTFSC